MQEKEGGVILQKRDALPFIFPPCDLMELGSKTSSRKRLHLYLWLLREAQVNPLQIQAIVIRLFLQAVLVGLFSLCQNQQFNLLRLISETLGFIFSCRHCTIFGVQWWGGRRVMGENEQSFPCCKLGRVRRFAVCSSCDPLPLQEPLGSGGVRQLRNGFRYDPM